MRETVIEVAVYVAPMVLATSLYAISGIYQDFELNISIATMVLLFIGLIPIVYISIISEEKFFLTISKLLLATLLWFCFCFGGVAAIKLLTENNPLLFGALAAGSAIACWRAIKCLERLNDLG